MKLVLCENIRGLGSTGEVVQVKDGYARNFLLPKRMAVQPSESNVRRLRKAREVYLMREKDKIEGAKLIAGKMAELVLTIEMKANEGGQLFGSVTESIVAERLGQVIGTEFHPQQIILGSHFKKIGDYHAFVRVHSEVEVEITLSVQPEAPEEVKTEAAVEAPAEEAGAAPAAEVPAKS